ncbi:MAG: hypothetical protein J6J11_00755 [Treponema sp.]|nr:hypothetical protein [Treponema sp.]
MDFDDIKIKFRTFIHEKTLLSFVLGILLAFFLIAMIIIYIQSSPKQSKLVNKQENIILDSEIMIPNLPNVEKDYYPSRITKNKWTKEEVEEWLTVPNQENLKQIENSNDKIIKELIGVAP